MTHDHVHSKDCWCEPVVEIVEGAPDVLTAAAYLWAMFSTIEWDPEVDDPEDIEFYERARGEALTRWPWLDEAAETYGHCVQDGKSRAISI